MRPVRRAKPEISAKPCFSGDADPEAILAARRYPVSITETIAATIGGPAETDPVGRQYLPSGAELSVLPEESPDPIGDDVHSPVKGIVHRYLDRVLLKPVHACAVYCRFCFRREMVGPGKEALSAEELETALDYIRTHTDIWEAIVTGGDPFILSARRLEGIVRALEEIRHVQVIRFHTRVPVADPKRITDALCTALEAQKPVYVSLHVNHLQEFTPEAEDAIARLQKAGCTLVSQSVLLKGVNDNVEALEALFRKLVSLRVRPYYLHHCDLAPGTAHFRTSIAEGQALMKALRGRLSGLCLPQYMLDIPGGHGKVPVGPDYVRMGDNGCMVEDIHGHMHDYPQGVR